ncbi:MAG: hypothetical protein RLZZ127_2033 [Planctomycetota bacterium]|jgi:hypothetical protein
MAQRQTTVLRLERRAHDEQSRGLAALHAAYDALSSAVAAAAQARGVDAHDPVAAATALGTAPDPDLARLAGELWLVFFESFRPDEGQHELALFRERADDLNRRLAEAAGRVPDGELVRDLLVTLAGFWRDRHQQVNERLDALIGDLGRQQRAAGAGALAGAYAQDELQRLGQLVDAALGDRTDAPPSQRLAALLARYRDELVRRREAAEQGKTALAAAAAAVAALAAGKAVPAAVHPLADPLLAQVRRIDEQRRAHEDAIRGLHRKVAELEADRRRLMDEVQAAESRLERLDDGSLDTDQRLQLYREAFATLSSGGDPKSALERVRELERVVTLAPAAAEAARKAVDRALDQLVDRLGELWAVVPLGEDPRRFKPRLFKKAFDRSSLPGVLIAARDACRDATAWIDRARWAQGAARFAGQVPALRSILRELVSLVADWRKKLGEPPPASISISLDGGQGILALPAVLQADVESMLRRRGAAAAAADLAPLLEAVRDRLRAVCDQAAPGAPAAEPPAKRESPGTACARLCLDLVRLSAHAGAVLAEAADEDFRLDPADATLMADDALLRATVLALTIVTDEAGRIPGAPALPAPAGTDLAGWHGTARTRTAWLEDLARHRIVVG